MIVCHCNRIQDGEIRRGCLELLSSNPNASITAVAVYNGLAKKPRCGGCLTLATGIIQGCLAECRLSAKPCAASHACAHRHAQDHNHGDEHALASDSQVSEHGALVLQALQV